MLLILTICCFNDVHVTMPSINKLTIVITNWAWCLLRSWWTSWGNCFTGRYCKGTHNSLSPKGTNTGWRFREMVSLAWGDGITRSKSIPYLMPNDFVIPNPDECPSTALSFLKDFIYLFMRERHRQGEKQAPCRAEAGCRTQSQDPGIMI